jgi:hypothetical protein
VLELRCTQKLYAVIFIYLYLRDEVVDNVPMQSHDFDITWVAPRECGIWRGNDYSRWAHCLDPEPKRWLTRCRCRTRRGHWSNLLPSSGSF